MNKYSELLTIAEGENEQKLISSIVSDMGKGFHIYVALDEEENPLYVGQTVNLQTRIMHHRVQSKWRNQPHTLYVAKLPSKSVMDIYEIFLINTLLPVHNIADKRGDIIGLMKLEKLEMVEFGKITLLKTHLAKPLPVPSPTIPKRPSASTYSWESSLEQKLQSIQKSNQTFFAFLDKMLPYVTELSLGRIGISSDIVLYIAIKAPGQVFEECGVEVKGAKGLMSLPELLIASFEEGRYTCHELNESLYCIHDTGGDYRMLLPINISCVTPTDLHDLTVDEFWQKVVHFKSISNDPEYRCVNPLPELFSCLRPLVDKVRNQDGEGAKSIVSEAPLGIRIYPKYP